METNVSIIENQEDVKTITCVVCKGEFAEEKYNTSRHCPLCGAATKAYCGECHARIEDSTDKFCRDCGEELFIGEKEEKEPDTRTPKEKLEEDVAEMKEQAAVTVPVMVEFAKELIEEYGEDIGTVMGRYIASTVVPTIQALNESKLSDEGAKATAQFCEKLDKELASRKFSREERIAIIIGSTGSR